MGKLPLPLIPVVVASVTPAQWLRSLLAVIHNQGPLEALWRRYSYPR